MTFSVLPEVLTASRFYVELNFDGSSPIPDAYFKECKGVQYSQEVAEIAEVTPEIWGVRGKPGRFMRTKIPSTTKITNLTLKRGLMTDAIAMWDWMHAIAEPSADTEGKGGWAKYRVSSGKIVIYTQSGDEGAIFTFSNAWPIKYAMPDIGVGSSDLAIEELEIAVEDFRRLSSTS
ncbi:MAG: phage tail protein [Cyanobacteria bacterium J06627_8]